MLLIVYLCVELSEELRFVLTAMLGGIPEGLSWCFQLICNCIEQCVVTVLLICSGYDF